MPTKIYCVLIGLIISGKLFCQSGISARFSSQNFSSWEKTMQLFHSNNEDLFPFAPEFAVDYRFALKNYRIEFFPEVSFGLSETKINVPDQVNPNIYSYKKLGFAINTRIYPFDFLGDCDCPTFSRQGNFFTTSFFVYAGVGVDYYMNDLEIMNSVSSGKKNSTTPHLDFGLGMDISLNRLVYISPFIGWSFSPSINWSGFGSAHQIQENAQEFDKTKMQLFEFGVRVGLDK